MSRRDPNALDDPSQRYVTCQTCGTEVAAEDTEWHKKNECQPDPFDGFDWVETWVVEHPLYGRMHYFQFSHAWWFVESDHERDEDVGPDDVTIVAFMVGVPPR